MKPLNNLDETEIIRIFQKNLNNKKFFSEDVEVFNLDKSKIIVKTDTLVESTDIPNTMNLRDAARKSVMACISDFAAKGVRPQYGTISVNLPREITCAKINQISKGFAEASKEYGIFISGGDTNEGKEIVFNVCVFGKDKSITPRKGAKIGDLLFVTGPFGYTPVGLGILMKKIKPKRQTSFTKKCTNAFLRPKPNLDFGIKCKKYFSSSMDSSDGLSSTLNEMANQSKKKFVVNNIPTKDEVEEFAKKQKINLKSLIFHGGEEYETVFTVPPKHKKIIQKNAKMLKMPLIEIGYVTKGKNVFIKENGRQTQLKDLGWKHFS